MIIDNFFKKRFVRNLSANKYILGFFLFLSGVCLFGSRENERKHWKIEWHKVKLKDFSLLSCCMIKQSGKKKML